MSPRSICSNPFILASQAQSCPLLNGPSNTSNKSNNTTTYTNTTKMPSDDKSTKSRDWSDIPRERQGDRPDYTKPLPRSKLPAELQETLDNEEKLWSTLYEGKGAESTDSSVRYAGYASRVRTILLSAHRYVAYTSDIGESFRPVAHPYLIKGAYGVSWAYLAGDVAHEGYKAYLRNQRILNPGEQEAGGDKTADTQSAVAKLAADVTGGGIDQAHPGKIPAIEDYRAVMAQRAVFQSVASMGLPAFTIHSLVKYSGKALANTKNVKLRAYGPIGLGLAAVPALPFMFDKPVEHAVEFIFHKTFELVGGPEAVGNRPETGRSKLMTAEARAGAEKEKEL